MSILKQSLVLFFLLCAPPILRGATCFAEDSFSLRREIITKCASEFNDACNSAAGSKLHCAEGKGTSVNDFRSSHGFRGSPRIYSAKRGFIVEFGKLFYENGAGEGKTWPAGIFLCPYRSDQNKNLRLDIQAPMFGSDKQKLATYDFSFYQILAKPNVWQSDKGMYPSDKSFETIACKPAQDDGVYEVFDDELSRIESASNTPADYFACIGLKKCGESLTKLSESASRASSTDPVVTKFSSVYKRLNCETWDRPTKGTDKPKKKGVSEVIR